MNNIKRFLNMLMVPLRPILQSLKNSLPVLLTILFFIMLFGVWTYGDSWGFDDIFRNSKIDHKLINYVSFGSRLAITVFILFIVSLFFLYKLITKNQAIQQEKLKLEKTKVEEDRTLPYVKDQEEILGFMVNTLKQSIGNKDFLYQLPWYLVIGANEAGKTSFINRSNQKFTLTEVERSAKRYQRKYSEYKINWWASDEAILIDPDGELFMQQQSETDEKAEITHALWNHLIGWLNKVRPRRPLNGVILVVDLPDLVGTSNSQRKAMAIIMRNRIRELMDEFGARIPVYVVLNKFDLIEGFSDFYADLDKAERQNTLGFSFTLNTNDDIDVWTQELEESYLKFISGIEEVVFDKLAKTIDKNTRESLYMFVREMTGLKEILLQYLCDILESDRFTTTPYVRGVYFSSVFQQGIPIDFYQTALSKHFNIPQVLPTVVQERKQKSFFSYDFFHKVVYPESGLVADNEKLIAKMKLKRTQSYLLLGMVFMSLVIGWQYYYVQNKKSAERVLELTKEFSALAQTNEIDLTAKNLLKPLNILREATFEFGHYKDALPLIEDLGLYQGKKIGEKLDGAYAKLLSEKFLPSLGLGLIHEMDSLPNSSDKGLEILRIYRMIDDKPNRQIDMTNQWMAGYWQRHFPNDGELQRQLMSHFEYAMKYIDPDLSAYDRIISKKQQEFSNISLAERVYRNFKATANSTLNPATNLRNEIGSAFDVVYQTPDEPTKISGDSSSNIFVQDDASMEGVILSPLFTNWAYTDYYVPKAENIIELAMIDSWVLGKKENIDFSKEDLKKLSESVRNLYLSDYVNTWREGLSNLRIVPFRDVSHAEQVLESIIGTAQPFQNLVKTVKKNSQIYPTIKDASATEKNIMLKDVNRAAAMKVTNEFARLSNLISDNPEGASYLDEIMTYIRDLHAYLKSISSSVEPGKAALKEVRSELKLEKVSPITVLRRVSTGVPEPLASHLNQLADNAWNVVLTAAIQELERKWQEDVYEFYITRISDKYPFNSHSRSSVSLKDFELFFGKNGKLQTFYDSDLKLFLKDNKEVLVLDGGRSLVDANFLDSLQDAWDIQDAFFDNTGKLGIKFALQPLGLSGQYRTATMSIDGQIVKYNHGRSYASKLIWPNTIRDNIESKLTVVTASGKSNTLKRTGDWSWFRVLDKAQISARTNQSIDLRFGIGGNGAMIYRLTTEDTNNPFIRMPFDHFTLPESLLATEQVVE
ncbi:MAG: type VI secretion system membrane subunit TssM [Gammaproteobacteria bacterium]|nr:type VI secretion system membrane subunit TssM [Gammaproteobacteria bacterium]